MHDKYFFNHTSLSLAENLFYISIKTALTVLVRVWLEIAPKVSYSIVYITIFK